MPARSAPENAWLGTDEPDLRHELGMASDSPRIPGRAPAGMPIVAPAVSSWALSAGPEDPQPYNPQLQLQNGMTDWLNIKALGGRGDGVADDTGIFQAANLLAAQPPGQLIYIPAGVYRLTQNVVFTTGVQWLMMGTLAGGFTLSGGTQVTFGSSGLPNVFAAAGDLLYSTGVNTPTRLPIGAGGTVLTSAGGVPTWATPVTGFADPTTTTGDLIFRSAGGTTRLPIGASGQVLAAQGSPLVPTWINNPAGFADPTTTKGDLIFKNGALATVRLPIGAASQVLQVAGGIPSWQSLASTLIQPSGDTTGATDRIAINAAIAALTGGGVIVLGTGQFYVDQQITLPAQTTAGTAGGNPVCLRGQGPATVINTVAGKTYSSSAGAGVLNYHRTSGYGAQFNQLAQPTIGYIRDLVINGATASVAGTVGLDVGDGWGTRVLDVTIVNFDSTGQIGLQIANRVFWCEKQEYRCNLMNNTTACYMTTFVPGSDHSHEYNVYDFYIFCNQNQQGVVNDGVNQGGSILYLHGNMCQTTATSGPPTGNVAALSLINTTGQNNGESRWYSGQIYQKVEFNQSAQFPTGTVAPYSVYSDGIARGVQQCSGMIAASNLTSANLNGCEFSFFGPLVGDPNLAQAFPGAPGSQNTITSNPAVPASGTIQQNYGPNASVYVSGGTVSGVSINGIPTGATSGPFYVCAGGSITLNYSVAPTWTWVPAAQSSF